MTRHWDEASIKVPRPTWVALTPGPISEDLQRGGCYAVFNPDGQLIYVGVALSEHNPTRPRRKAGLIQRLFRHVIIRGGFTKRLQLEAKRDAWLEHGGIGKIMILPFPAKYSYLAAALEVFLIQELGAGLAMNKSRVRKELAAAV